MDYLAEHNQDLIVNLGTGRGASVKDVVATTEKVIGKKIPYIMSDRRDGDPASLFASSKKASELLGWEPRHSSLENMITTTWNIYRRHLETQTATPETN